MSYMYMYIRIYIWLYFASPVWFPLGFATCMVSAIHSCWIFWKFFNSRWLKYGLKRYFLTFWHPCHWRFKIASTYFHMNDEYEFHDPRNVYLEISIIFLCWLEHQIYVIYQKFWTFWPPSWKMKNAQGWHVHTHLETCVWRLYWWIIKRGKKN